jgi:MarR family transcriptional regulator, organic hydroperoxide resistance regulator
VNEPRRRNSRKRTLEQAAHVARDLEAIRRALRDSILHQTRQLPVAITPPQLRALEILVEEARASGNGLSLSELSRRMGLTHSTVSGIVSRLEQRELLQRTTRPDDRRFVEIALPAPVKRWLEQDLPDARLQPLATALSRAKSRERAAVVEGLEILARLLSDAEPRSADG